MKNLLATLRQDFSASLVVFFVAIPLCLGIALASNSPLFSGIIAGIVGGIVVGSLSGSNFGVSGPAAGLVVIISSFIAKLEGWENFLTAVVLAGFLQILMGFLRLGNIAYYFPSSVIKGMLSGIGLIIIFKQIPLLIGYNGKSFNSEIQFEIGLKSAINQGDFGILQNILNCFDSQILLIGLTSLAILIAWETKPARIKIFSQIFFAARKFIQAPLMAIFIGIFFANFLELNEQKLVQIPLSKNIAEFFTQFSRPNLAALANPQTYIAALIIAAVASIETLLSVEATDRLDPLKRITPTNRELKAQGIGNLISGLIGGLPITQVIIRSSTNISFGAKTKFSTILHGFWLFIAVLCFPKILNMIPLASLAAILIIVGFKLCNPSIFKKIFHLGAEQFMPFIATAIGMILFDLLKAVGIGIIVAIGFILYHNFRNSHKFIKNFEGENHQHIIQLAQEVSFLNKGEIIQILRQVPDGSKLVIDGSNSKIIDFDIIEIINDFKISAKSRNIQVKTEGILIKKSKTTKEPLYSDLE